MSRARGIVIDTIVIAMVIATIYTVVGQTFGLVPIFFSFFGSTNAEANPASTTEADIAT
jgi:hypothetical protein